LSALLLCAGSLAACAAAPSSRAAPPYETVSASDVVPGHVAAEADRFSAQPTADHAVAFVHAARAAGDPRYGAHLLDLVRIGYSNTSAELALEGLAELSGIPRTHLLNDEYLTYGQWVLEQAPEPPADYAAFKAALYRQVDDEFVPLLLATTDRRALAGLQWGGVAVGAIRELNAPSRLRMEHVAWSQPDEAVFGVVGADGSALAYPERVLARHELANDELAGVPVSVSFCTLCRSARAFDRRVDGRTLTFRTSGLLLYSNKVMVDNETGSLWQQLTGRAIGGPLTGHQLFELPIETTTWSDWQHRHPASQVIDRPAPTIVDPETGALIGYDYIPDGALAHYFASAALWYPVLATPPVFPLKEPVATLALDGAYLAVSIAAMASTGTAPIDVGGRQVIAEAAPRGVRFRDTSDGKTLPAGQSFWFAWYGLHPDTVWWPA
jgi:hypothetical protein